MPNAVSNRALIASKSTMSACFVSFVIPAFNEARYIASAIASIQQSMQGNAFAHEIIVVDDDSSDATAEIARQHEAIVVQVHQRNIAAVRNAGASRAHGDFLIFVEHCEKSSNLLLPDGSDGIAINPEHLSHFTGGRLLIFPHPELPGGT